MCERTSNSTASTSDGMPSIGTGQSDKCTYHVSNHQQRTNDDGALVDGGANGGVGGNDVCVINFTGQSVDITGIDHHQITDKPICTAGGVTKTHAGPVIAIMHQQAYHGHGRMILAPAQLEAFGVRVNKRHRAFGGLQAMVTPDGYVIPIKIRNGLPYILMRPYTDDEWNTLPHITLTSNLDWDPSAYDHDPMIDDENWVDSLQELAVNPHDNKFDQLGGYKLVHLDATPPYDTPILDAQLHFFDAESAHTDLDDLVNECVDYHAHFCDSFDGVYVPDATLPFLECNTNKQLTTSLHPHDVKTKALDYQALCPLFAGCPLTSSKRLLR